MKTDTKTKHTPGPWSAKGLAVYAENEINGFGGPVREYLRPICTFEDVDLDENEPFYTNGRLTYNVRWPSYCEAEANARLIAASPDLLGLAILCNAYLEPIADQLEVCHNQPSEARALRQLLTQAKQAIAKARGET